MFRCTGMKVNAVAYQSKLSDKMERNGSLKVDQYLQVEEIANVFAIGDCNNVAEFKLAFTARRQAGKGAHFYRLVHVSHTFIEWYFGWTRHLNVCSLH